MQTYKVMYHGIEDDRNVSGTVYLKAASKLMAIEKTVETYEGIISGVIVDSVELAFNQAA